MALEQGAQRIPMLKTTLDNGLRVVTCEVPHVHSVSISVFVGVGSRYELLDHAGVSHFIEHMLFKGTQRRPYPGEVSLVVEGAGGVLNAGTEQEFTVYWCKVARPNFRQSLDLLIDMLRNSLFEPEAIEKERMVVIEELNMINDHPSYKVDVLIDELLWPGHPLGRDIGGTRKSVEGISREMLLSYMGRFYGPTNIVVSIAGNISHAEAVDLLGVLSDDWTPSTTSCWERVAHIQSAPKLRLEYHKTEQTSIAIGVPGVSLQHPDRYALALLSVVLGEGMASRLFVEVREKKGLAYDIGSSTVHFLDSGALLVGAGVDPRRIYDATQTILSELASIRESVSEEELENAKRLSTGRILLGMEDTRVISGWMGNQELLTGNILDVDEVKSAINAVTLDDVHRIARELLLTEKLNMAVIGPNRAQQRLERLLSL